VVQVGMSKISGCTISLQAAVHPGAAATGTHEKNARHNGTHIVPLECRVIDVLSECEYFVLLIKFR
jgi:hypothetical protein